MTASRQPLLLSVALGLAFLAHPRQAHADEAETKECAAAYEHTQRLQQKSDLISALDEAERCSRPSCPALLKDECSRWASELKPKLPSLIIRVRGRDGCSQTNVKVDIGGASRRDPTSDAVHVDPGVHDIKVTDPVSGTTKTQTINFAAGERRDIDVDFAPENAVCGKPPTKTPLGKIPTLTLVIGSLGGGLLVAGATVGIIGALKRSDLDECKPNCSSDRIDAVRPFFLAGDVLAGFGLLGIGAAIVTYFAVDTKTSASRSRVVFGASGIGGSF